MTAFSVIEYLNNKGISYFPGGTKNVSKGWVGIKCPFCSDKSNHGGINLYSGIFKCWICKTTTDPISLIQKIEDCSKSLALEIVKKYSSNYDLTKWENLYKKDTTQINEVKLPSDAMPQLTKLSQEWLVKRNFDPDFVFEKYNLRCTGIASDWKFRLIVPIYMNHKLVSYLGRDITDKAYLPYKNCKNDEAIVPVHNCLYNIDTVGYTAVVMEGVTDVWRFGEGGVAVLGDSYTTNQVKLLSGIKRVFVMFDAEPEAQKLAEQFAYDVASIVPEVKTLELDEGDPADMSNEDVVHLRRQIFGKI